MNPSPRTPLIPPSWVPLIVAAVLLVCGYMLAFALVGDSGELKPILIAIAAFGAVWVIVWGRSYRKRLSPEQAAELKQAGVRQAQFGARSYAVATTIKVLAIAALAILTLILAMM